MMNKISIIMPVYNAGEFLLKSINSLVNQTYKNIEIICINDGSKDNSLQILQDFTKKDSRIKIFDQQNSGPAKARNLGLENASGDYIMFCDADDWYEPTMIEEMLNAITQNNVDFAMCDCNVIEEKNHNRSGGDINYHKLNNFGLYQLDDNHKLNINVVLWNKIFKKSVIDKYDIKFPIGYESDDLAFIYQYLSVSKTFYGLNKQLYNYRLLANSIMGKFLSNKSNDKIFDVIYVFEFVIKFLSKHNIFKHNLWVLKGLLGQISWYLNKMSKEANILFLQKINQLITSLLADDILKNYPQLLLCKKKQYQKAIDIFNGFKKYKLLGLTIFKIKKSKNKQNYYFLGMKLYQKKLW